MPVSRPVEIASLICRMISASSSNIGFRPNTRSTWVSSPMVSFFHCSVSSSGSGKLSSSSLSKLPAALIAATRKSNIALPMPGQSIAPNAALMSAAICLVSRLFRKSVPQVNSPLMASETVVPASFHLSSSAKKSLMAPATFPAESVMLNSSRAFRITPSAPNIPSMAPPKDSASPSHNPLSKIAFKVVPSAVPAFPHENSLTNVRREIRMPLMVLLNVSLRPSHRSLSNRELKVLPNVFPA